MTHFQNLLYSLITRIDYSLEGTCTRDVLLSAWGLFVRLWPYICVGIIGSAVLIVILPRERISAFFRRRSAVSILLASCLGTVMPLGAYSTIPLCAALLMAGVPVAPLVAFLVASPLMNPNLFFITSGALGYQIALFRVVSALLLGVAAGGLTRLLLSGEGAGYLRSGLKLSRDGVGTPCPEKGEKAGDAFPRVLSRELLKMGRFTAMFLLPSILVAAAVSVCVPPVFIWKLFSSHTALSVPLAAVAGVPLYVCGGAAVPVVQELYTMGMSKGAMMAFFIAGPATKLSTLVALKSVFRLPFFLIYIAVTITGALVIGFLSNAMLH